MNQGEADQFYIENCLPAIISREMFERVQALREQKKIRGPAPGKYPLSRKIICGECGATLERRICRLGKVSWICARHNSGRELCPSAPVHERDIYTAFIRMYNKLKRHEGIILQPAINQMEGLEDALRRKNPAILEINQEIAAATERSYKISKLRSGGLLDADAYTAQLAANNARLTQLRAKRRRLLQNDDIADAAEAIRQTVDTIRQGPERLTAFDEVLFETLTEGITAESAACFRFRLRGGIEVTERLGRDAE